MSEKVEVKIGQTWRSRDRRDNGSTVKVVAIIDSDHVRVKSVRTRSIMTSTLRQRYRLVSS